MTVLFAIKQKLSGALSSKKKTNYRKVCSLYDDTVIKLVYYGVDCFLAILTMVLSVTDTNGELFNKTLGGSRLTR